MTGFVRFSIVDSVDDNIYFLTSDSWLHLREWTAELVTANTHSR